MFKKMYWFVLVLLFVPVLEVQAAFVGKAPTDYQLQQVVVLSRHNIRSPLSANGSALSRMTPHPWFNWTSGPSDLSLRGGELETLMGQYFRKWLVSAGLMEENEIPKRGQMRFYANSMQRTIATAQYFSSGMLPVANVRIEHRYKPNRMDPVFCPRMIFISEAFKKLALEQIALMGAGKGLQGIGKGLTSEYKLLEKVLDFRQSTLSKENQQSHFRTDDLEIILTLNEEPSMRGSLKLANQASDALILQYYEEPDLVKAAFGHHLRPADWEAIARVKDVYGDVLFTAPAVAVNVSHPLLKEMLKELNNKQRKFTFLCGHDSNLASVLAALEVEPYLLPNSIEKKTPIGSKMVIGKWLGKDGKEYISLDLVYQNKNQLRHRDMLSLANPPEVFSLSLQGLVSNTDGLYALADVQARFKKAIEAFYALPKD